MTLLYSGLTAGLISGHVMSDRTLASVVASLMTIPLSFVIHRQVTYRDTDYQRVQWRRFTVVALTNLALNAGLMAGTAALRWPYGVALIVGWILVPTANYLLNALWVFRTRNILALDR